MKAVLFRNFNAAVISRLLCFSVALAGNACNSVTVIRVWSKFLPNIMFADGSSDEEDLE